MELRGRKQGHCSDDVLLELIKLNDELVKLVRDTIIHRDDQACASDRLSNKIDQLSAKQAQFEVRVMGQFESLTAKVSTLTAENAEILAFIAEKGVELQAAKDANAALLARIAELEPNQITQADRDEIAASEAAIQAVSDALNTFTPAPVVVPDPVPDPVPVPDPNPPVDPPVEPSGFRNRR